MNTTKVVAIVSIQLAVVTLVLVAILATMQGQAPAKPDYVGCYHHDGNGGWTYSVPCPA